MTRFVVDDNGWEIVDKERRWSDAVDTSLFHEHFIAVPGYGDATLLVEQVTTDASFFKKKVPSPVCEPGIFRLSFIFSLKQRLRLLGFCPPLLYILIVVC